MYEKKILVVEDNAIIAFSYIAFLQAEGFEQIKHITKGASVEKTVNEFNPDLIIMNVMLADNHSGLDAASAIRESYETPIIFITGMVNEIDSISNSHQLSKPLNFSLLSGLIKNIFKD